LAGGNRARRQRLQLGRLGDDGETVDLLALERVVDVGWVRHE